MDPYLPARREYPTYYGNTLAYTHDEIHSPRIEHVRECKTNAPSSTDLQARTPFQEVRIGASWIAQAEGGRRGGKARATKLLSTIVGKDASPRLLSQQRRPVQDRDERFLRVVVYDRRRQEKSLAVRSCIRQDAGSRSPHKACRRLE